jgi:hypothetical protein
MIHLNGTYVNLQASARVSEHIVDKTSTKCLEFLNMRASNQPMRDKIGQKSSWQ